MRLFDQSQRSFAGDRGDEGDDEGRISYRHPSAGKPPLHPRNGAPKLETEVIQKQGFYLCISDPRLIASQARGGRIRKQ